MSMANSLEIRSPFLDKELVQFVNNLPSSYKIDGSGGKVILKQAFGDMLPWEILSRPKHGFEVPLLQWIKNDDEGMIWKKFLSKEYIKTQGYFDSEEIEKLKSRTYSRNPGDAVAEVWGLFAFQYWYNKHILNA
jgi:asparagine synthase (glutamine-hydrolysing)